MRILIAESEPPAARQKRRDSVGRSSGETFIKRLRQLVPDATCHRVKPADHGSQTPDASGIESYDAVFVSGSPLHLYEDTPETRREIAFMRAVFRLGTPSFGSCAGLQVAVVAAGGKIRAMKERREVGFARRIVRKEGAQGHALLGGRPSPSMLLLAIPTRSKSFPRAPRCWPLIRSRMSKLPRSGMIGESSGASNITPRSRCARWLRRYVVSPKISSSTGSREMNWTSRRMQQAWRLFIRSRSVVIWPGGSGWMSKSSMRRSA